MVESPVVGRWGSADTRKYPRQGNEFRWARCPLSAFPLDSPPLTILVFTLSVLPPIADYISVYACWMAGVFLVGYFAFRRFSSPQNASIYAVYLLLGATGALLGRFDLFPALLTVAAFWAGRQRRFTFAYLFLAAGALLKLYP